MQVLDINNSIIDKGYYKEPVINIIGVGGETRKIAGFKPYFYARLMKEMKNEILETFRYMNYTFETTQKYLPMYFQIEKSEVVRIYASDPREIRTLRETVRNIPGVLEIYEADVLFKNRFMVDKGIFGMHGLDKNNKPYNIEKDEPIRILGFDIEVLPPESLRMPTSETDEIIVVTFAFSHEYNGQKTLVLIVGDSESYEDIIFCKDEKSLLYIFNEVFQEYNPDIITGYNINGFDFEYIMRRMELNFIKPLIGRNNSSMWIRKGFGNTTISIQGRVIFDLLPLIKANYNYTSYNLKTISHELLKNDKIDLPMKQLREEYINNNYKNTIEYARKDAILTLELLYKTKFLDKYIAISKLTGLLLQDCVNSRQTQKIEIKIMREYLKEDRLIAMAPLGVPDDKNVKYEGATVLKAKEGLIEDVVVLDYKSLYPTIMISQNYSYDTLIKEEERLYYEELGYPINKAFVGGWFISSTVKKGIVPRILEELLAERIRIKKLMKVAEGPEKDYLDARQYALKILLNSFYGYSGYSRARLYHLDIASAVTSFGRENIKETKSFIENINDDMYSFKVVYGDTDSVFIEVKSTENEYGKIPLDTLKEIGVTIGKERSKQLPAPMELLYEKIAKRIIFEAKKKYAYYRYDQDKNGKWIGKITSSGIETKRRNACKIVGTTLEGILDKILIENDTQKAIKVVRDAISFIENLEYSKPEDLECIILSTKYSKPINEYKVVPIHIRVAQKMIERNEQLSIGDRISYLIVEGDGKFNRRAQNVQEILKSKLEIDRKYYIETQLLPPIDRFFKCINVSRKAYYLGLQSSKKDKILLKTNGKSVKQKSLFSYE